MALGKLTFPHVPGLSLLSASACPPAHPFAALTTPVLSRASRIQVAPNFCRTLASFGILDELTKQAVRLERNSVRRYANDKQLGTTSFASLEERFGFPTFVVHRGDLHKALLDKALELGTVLKVDVSGACSFAGASGGSARGLMVILFGCRRAGLRRSTFRARG